MSKIVVNKNFNYRYLSKFVDLLFWPNGAQTVADNSDSNIDLYYWTGDNGTRWTYDRTGDTDRGKIYICYPNMVSSVDYTYTISTGDPCNGNNIAQQGSPLMWVNRTFIDTIDRINEKIRDGEIWQTELGNKNTTTTLPSVNINYLFNTLFCNNTTYRRNALQWLVNNNIITTDEQTAINKTISSITQYNVANKTRVNIDSNRFTKKYKYSQPLKLTNPYRVTNNLLSEKMFLVFITYSSYQFDNILGNMTNITNDVGYNSRNNVNPDYRQNNYYSSSQTSSYTREHDNTRVYKSIVGLYSKEKAKVYPQAVYVALEVGLTGSGADIEFDNLDKVDYIDDFQFQFNSFKELS